jgi:hypothetical protein
MAKKVIIEVTDDAATQSCDIVVKMTPSMDEATKKNMKKAIVATLPRLIDKAWKEFTEINK